MSLVYALIAFAAVFFSIAVWASLRVYESEERQHTMRARRIARQNDLREGHENL